MIAVLLALVALQEPVVVAKDAIQPHMALDSEGTVYITFIRGGQIEITISSDEGKTFSAPVVAIDAGGKARGGMQRGPRVAVDGKKAVYVTAPLAFDPSNPQKVYPNNDLYLAVSTDGGKTFSKPVMVNDVPQKAPEALHWLAASPDEGAFVAWLDLRLRDKGQDLFGAKISGQGRKISKNGLVAQSVCECCAPGLAMDAKGNPSFIYREGGKTNRQIYLVASSNGGSSFAQARRLSTGESQINSCPMDAPAVAVSPDGKTVATAWMDMRSKNQDVYWTITTGGKSLPDTPVHDDRANYQGHPSLTIAADGTAWCAWEDCRSGPNAQRIYVTDSKTKQNVAVSAEAEGKCSYPTIVAGKGLVGVVYEVRGGVSFRILSGR